MKTYTIKKNYEFKKVLDKGKFFGSNTIQVFIRQNNKKNNRIGIAISKKNGKAVKRNKVKRLIREVFKDKNRLIKQGYDFIFLWNKKTPIQEATYQSVRESIEKIFERAELYI